MKKIKLSESRLRKIIREELIKESKPTKIGLQAVGRMTTRGYTDVEPIVDEYFGSDTETKKRLWAWHMQEWRKSQKNQQSEDYKRWIAAWHDEEWNDEPVIEFLDYWSSNLDTGEMPTEKSPTGMEATLDKAVGSKSSRNMSHPRPSYADNTMNAGRWKGSNKVGSGFGY